MRGESFSRRIEDDSQHENEKRNDETLQKRIGNKLRAIFGKLSEGAPSIESTEITTDEELEGVEGDGTEEVVAPGETSSNELESIDDVAKRLTVSETVENIDTLLENGADPRKFFGYIPKSELSKHLDAIIGSGVRTEELLRGEFNMLTTSTISENLDLLMDNSDNPAILLNYLPKTEIAKHLDSILDHGVSVDELMDSGVGPRLTASGISENLNTLLEHGADLRIILQRMPRAAVANNIDVLIAHNMSVEDVMSHMTATGIIDNLDSLTRHGANIDINEIASRMKSSSVASHLDMLAERGVVVDIDELVSKLSPESTIDNLDMLNKHGADIDINQLVQRMTPDLVLEKLSALMAHGADIDVNDLARRLPSDIAADNLDSLLESGVSADILIDQMYADDVIRKVDTLLEHGANPDHPFFRRYPAIVASHLDSFMERSPHMNLDELVNSLYRSEGTTAVYDHIDTLLEHGADVNNPIFYRYPAQIASKLDVLVKHGAAIDVGELTAGLSPNEIVRNLDHLIDGGANIDVNELVSRLSLEEVADNLSTLIEHGADIDVNDLATRLNNGPAVFRNLTAFVENGMTYDRENILGYYIMTDPDAVADNLDLHLEHKTTASYLVDNFYMNSKGINQNLGKLFDYGLRYYDLLPFLESESIDIDNNLDILQENGLVANLLINRGFINDEEVMNRNLGKLLEYGASYEALFPLLGSTIDIEKNLDVLQENGITGRHLVNGNFLQASQIGRNLEKLLEYGVNRADLLYTYFPDDKDSEILREYGITL